MFKLIISLFLLANLGLLLCDAKVAIKQEQKFVKDKPVCELCTLVLSAAKSLIDSNKTDDVILAFIEKNLCARLGSLNATCVQYVEDYGKIILYELSQKIDPSIVCNHLGLCETIKGLRPHPILKPLTDTLNCTLCKLVFQQVKTLLQSNQTDQEILEYIETNLCNATGPLSPTCKALVEKFGPAVLQELANDVDPAKLCELIGFCNKKQEEQNQSNVPENKKKTGAINPVYCTICEYAVQFLDVELKKNNTEEAIEKALKEVCKVAPKSSRTQCESIVNSYGLYLIELLIQFADPTKVCQAIKLC
jgi:saposin